MRYLTKILFSFNDMYVHFVPLNGTVALSEIVLNWQVRSLYFYKLPNQVLPGNLRNHVSTNHGLLPCKTLAAYLNVNMLADRLLKIVLRQAMKNGCFKKNL